MLRTTLLAAVASLVLACRGAAGEPSPAATGTAEPAAPALATASLPAATSAEAAAASASAPVPAPSLTPVDPTAAQTLAAEPPRPPGGKGAGFPGPVDAGLDGEWIKALATGAVTEVTSNRGGGSVSLKMRLAGGKKAAVKLEQTGHPTDPRAEIAAYHVDRLLGFGRTAVVVGRTFSLAELRAALVAGGADDAFLARFDKLVVARGGRVDAAMVAWHTAPLVEEETAPAWTATLKTNDPVTGDALSRLAEWSDLVAFDFLIDNPDRFSGGNILRLDRKGPLVFLDQGAAFGRSRLRDKRTTKDRLDEVCRFRKGTLAALARVGPRARPGEHLSELLAKSLARDPLAPVLDKAQLAGVDARVKTLAEHVRACQAKLGAAASL